jgi:RimJ/RimL family protein N-acetyltransferase
MRAMNAGELLTTRLRLRMWTPADREPFAEMNADPEVMRHFPAPLTRDESSELFERIVAHFRAHGFGLWAVAPRQDDRLLGFVGLQWATFGAPLCPCVEIAWRLTRPSWGRGYATEAARAALGHGFDVLKLPQIVAFTTPGNTRSLRVMERIGLQRSTDDDFNHPKLAGHPLERHVVYKLKREQWGNPPRQTPAPRD